MATRRGEHMVRLNALMSAAKFALYGQRYAEARALMDEVLALDDHCEFAVFSRWVRGNIGVFNKAPQDVFRALADTPRCPTPNDSFYLEPLVDAARISSSTVERPAVEARLARLVARTSAGPGCGRARFLQGRLLLDPDPERGVANTAEALLEAEARGTDIRMESFAWRDHVRRARHHGVVRAPGLPSARATVFPCRRAVKGARRPGRC